MPSDFHSPYRHGFVRLAAAVPSIRLADPAFNAERTIAQLREAAADGAAVVVFPELGLSGYSLDDLAQQDALLDASLTALDAVREATTQLLPLVFVGLPLRVEGQLFNVAAALQGGELLGVVPKRYLPNYREFYEARQYTAGDHAVATTAVVLGREVPFGSDLIFTAASHPHLRVHAEICEDMWVPVPPSTYAALAGATVLVNLSASNVTVGKADYRRLLCESHSARCLAAHVYTSAGLGESTTDLAWDGQAMIAENGAVLAESERFQAEDHLLLADVDLERLVQERMRMTSYNDQVRDLNPQLRAMRRVPFAFRAPTLKDHRLRRRVPRYPYVPSNPATLDQRCYEAINIQAHGLIQRMRATGSQRLVIGVSGGLDSTLALLVAVEAFDRLGLPRANILGYTMPGFATSTQTREQAHALMRALGVTGEEIDIRPSCQQMLADLGHPFAHGEPVYDITFENVQAGERTSHLFRLANQHRAFVLGTGDLSELALGWCTYGVGDHMSHYNVNASVPKTLIQYLILWLAQGGRHDAATRTVLEAIAGTTISPELVPADANGAMQDTEAHVGPYPLQDFTLYHLTRFGFRPSKIAYLAHQAWGDAAQGEWPSLVQDAQRRAYTLAEIKHWMELFITRFFVAQFKRSAVPNAPKVGGGGSLSPRGDWRMPSDASPEAWLRDLRENVPA
ncbi:MAG: NAD(+) synthase [Dyella sp.]|uniref:NAD(+) synthase n=1 Tax=Dyella sp. TaxID=1869338 RepID=UPI003F8076D9